MKRPIITTVLLCALCRASFAVILFSIQAPQDDAKVRMDISDRPDLQPLAAEYRSLVPARLWPLKCDDVAKVFGPKLETATNWWGYGSGRSGPTIDKHPTDLVLPILATRPAAGSNCCSLGMMLMVSGQLED